MYSYIESFYTRLLHACVPFVVFFGTTEVVCRNVALLAKCAALHGITSPGAFEITRPAEDSHLACSGRSWQEMCNRKGMPLLELFLTSGEAYLGNVAVPWACHQNRLDKQRHVTCSKLAPSAKRHV